MNPCEAEVDAIRLKLYEETKDLTMEERMKRTRSTVDKLAAQYGFKLAKSAVRVTHVCNEAADVS